MSFQQKSKSSGAHPNQNGGNRKKQQSEGKPFSGKPKHFNSGNGNENGKKLFEKKPYNNANANANVDPEYERAHLRHNNVKTEKSMNVTNGNDGFITVSLQEYVNGINSFELSMDALAICNQLGVSKENHWTIAVKSAINYLEALRGNSLNKKERDLLLYYNIGFVPEFSNGLRKNIAYIKWMLFASSKLRNFDDEFASFVGLLAGVCLYFNEKDLINEQNGRRTQVCKTLCKAYTVNEC
jgi:hypothetical protein